MTRAALQKLELARARLAGPLRDLRLPVDHREYLLRQGTAHINRHRWHLHEFDPAWDPAPRSLARRVHLDLLRPAPRSHAQRREP